MFALSALEDVLLYPYSLISDLMATACVQLLNVLVQFLLSTGIIVVFILDL